MDDSRWVPKVTHGEITQRIDDVADAVGVPDAEVTESIEELTEAVRELQAVVERLHNDGSREPWQPQHPV
jgi:alcohol dehydrogenase class IV